MVRVSRFGPVTRFDLARTLGRGGLYWTTCYHVGSTLIDTGCAHTAAEFVAALGDLPVDRILTTHCHEDHVGANGLLQAGQPGLKIHAHPSALPILANPRLQPQQPYRRVMWGWPRPSAGVALDDGGIVEDGRFRFQAVHTPGHAPDHLCFLVPDEGWLFSGDLYVGGRDRALRRDFDIGAIIASLQRVAALPVGTLFPGSARVRPDGAAALADKIAGLEEARDRVLALAREGHGDGEIARAAFGPPMPIEVLTFGHFSRRALVRSFLGRFDRPA
jgi:glyoxylase-like metal-dependent hydrolase (beta-lactamase superfamily II)